MSYSILSQRFKEYHALYGNRLANHLPMALYSLESLGASEQQLSNFFESYSKRLQLISDEEIMDFVSAEFEFGRTYQYYIGFFETKLNLLGQETFLMKYLNFFSNSLASSAFHALIRLAFAVEADNSDEMIRSFALFSIEYQSLDANPSILKERLEDILVKNSFFGEKCHFPDGIIVDRMNAIHRDIQAENHKILPSTITLEQLAEFTSNNLWNYNDFTILHTVTGLHAFRVLSKYFQNQDEVLTNLSYAILVATWSTGLKFDKKEIKIKNSFSSWDSIKEEACKSKNDHVIKLTYSCYEEGAFYDNPIYQQIAERAVFGTL